MMIDCEGRPFSHHGGLDALERRLIRQSARGGDCRSPDLPQLSRIGGEQNQSVRSGGIPCAMRQYTPPQVCRWGAGACGKVGS